MFGEGPADRRERLRQLLVDLGEDVIKKTKEGPDNDEDEKIKEEVKDVCFLVKSMLLCIVIACCLNLVSLFVFN